MAFFQTEASHAEGVSQEIQDFTIRAPILNFVGGMQETNGFQENRDLAICRVASVGGHPFHGFPFNPEGKTRGDSIGRLRLEKLGFAIAHTNLRGAPYRVMLLVFINEIIGTADTQV